MIWSCPRDEEITVALLGPDWFSNYWKEKKCYTEET